MDVVLIEQVLINLMENSVDHAVGMSRILFRVTVSEKLAVFEISDDGCGIPRDKLDKIFDGYFSSLVRADYNERRNMGIGLSVCAAIIKAHDGKIYAENNEEGGATFRFLLNME